MSSIYLVSSLTSQFSNMLASKKLNTKLKLLKKKPTTRQTDKPCFWQCLNEAKKMLYIQL